MKNSTRKKLLLVEDEVIQAMTGKMTLEKHDYQVITVDSGEKAVELAACTSDIDLILMDIDLGSGIDGTEAAAQILQNRDLPIVFLSSHTESAIVEKTEKITSYGYVVKNSSITVLDASIKMAFKLFDAKISERKKKEQLKISEQKFRTLFDHSPISIWEEDFSELKKQFDLLRPTEGKNWRSYFEKNPGEVARFASLVQVVDINNTGISFLQSDKKNLLGPNLTFGFNADSFEMFREELIALAEGKTYFETEISVSTSLEGIKSAFLGLAVAPGCTDTLSCVIVSCFDITERKRAGLALQQQNETLQQTEESAREANELFQTILDTIPQAICWKDINSVFLGCNANYAKMVGLSDTRAIIGKTDRDFAWTSEETDHFLKMDRKIMETDTVQTHIVETAFKETENEILLETNKSPLHDKNGKVCGIMVSCMDITRRTEGR